MKYDLSKGNVQMTAHFKLSEFQCKDGSTTIILNPKLIAMLEKLRIKAGKPLIINSAYRTPTYNKRVGGAKNSQHMVGNAADIVIKGMTVEQVAKMAEEIGFDGIGRYDSFTHVDVRGYKARWNERSGD